MNRRNFIWSSLAALGVFPGLAKAAEKVKLTDFQKKVLAMARGRQ